MSEAKLELAPTPTEEFYDKVVNPERSLGFNGLVRRLREEGVRTQDLTGDAYDIVMHGQLVGSIIMESFKDDPNSHINTGLLRMKIGELATLRETDMPHFVSERKKWQQNVRDYQATKPEIEAVSALAKDTENHPLQALVNHVLLSMGALLGDKEDNTATLGSYRVQAEQSA